MARGMHEDDRASRMFRVAVVSSLIAVGSAGDGVDLGGYAKGGSMNALCFTSVNPSFTPFNLKQYSYPGGGGSYAAGTLTGPNQVNYFITDAKTSPANWQYSYYSVWDSGMNNNADGQGSVAYDAPNSAVQLVGVSGGSFSRSVGATPTAGFQSSPPPPPTPVYTFPPAPPGPGLDIAPTSESSSMVKGRSVRGYFKSHVNPVGIQKVVFPSKYLGIAVGAATPTTAATNYPNILISKDNGASWHQVTGVPSYARSSVQPYYIQGTAATPTIFPLDARGAPDLFGLHCASKSLCWAVGGNGALAAASTGVRFDATKNAVSAWSPTTKVAAATVPVTGLFDWSLKYITTYPAVALPGAYSWDDPLAEESWAFAYGTGQIMITTNGGTVWRNVQITPDQTQIYAQYVLSPTIGANVYNNRYWPGTLLSVTSDPAGQYVWAVGVTPYQLVDDSERGGKGAWTMPQNLGYKNPAVPVAPATLSKFGFILNGATDPQYLDNGAAVAGAAAAATGFSVGSGYTVATTVTHWVTDYPFGTIMFSSNGGVTWNIQIPPTLASFYDYALFDVYYLKSNVVFAVGGNLNNPSGTAYTDETGGQAYLPFAYVPPNKVRQPSQYIGPGFGNGIILAFNGQSWYQMSYPGMTYGNAPAFTTITFNNGVGWVGGYTYKAGPLLNNLGQYEFIGGSAAYSVTATYPVNGTVQPYYVPGLSYTVLITLDQRTWTPAPAASFPPGFIERGTDFAPQIGSQRVEAQQDVYGIEWDNALRGWIYGGGSDYKSGFILSTQDGGNTWKYETPPDVLANGLHVKACSNVPISH